METIRQGLEHSFTTQEDISGWTINLATPDRSFVSTGAVTLEEGKYRVTWTAELTEQFPLANLALEMFNQDRTEYAIRDNYAVVRISTAITEDDEQPNQEEESE